MKLSKYNFFYTLSENTKETLIYNSRTNALAFIKNENLPLIQVPQDKPIVIKDEELKSNLLSGGFIVDKDINELDLLKLKLLSSRFNTKGLGLTIAPTLDCNFRCIYCYEKNSLHQQYMSNEVQERVFSFINKQADTLKNLSISWYGGEPLLALDVIENLSNKIIKLCSEKNINYQASIITNGYNLTKAYALKLKELNITSGQVTIDGTAEIHNSRRPLADGSKTFNTIIKNVKDCAEILNLTIRINTDKENAPKTDELLNILMQQGLKGKVGVYLGFVDTINDCYEDSKCFTREGSSKLNFANEIKLIKKGFNKDISHRYPRLYANSCGADCINAFVIAPDGLLYKCWNDIGIKEYAIGNIDTDSKAQKYNRSLFNTYMTYVAPDDPQCSKCKLLPICMGGCPNIRVKNNKNNCSEYMYNLEQYLVECARTAEAKLQ